MDNLVQALVRAGYRQVSPHINANMYAKPFGFGLLLADTGQETITFILRDVHGEAAPWSTRRIVVDGITTDLWFSIASIENAIAAHGSPPNYARDCGFLTMQQQMEDVL
jgi:hypothetical protein